MSPDGLTARDYESLISAFRTRRLELGMTLLDLDHSAGFCHGHASKIEAWQSPTGRGLGALSLPLILGALGLEIVVRPVPGPFKPRAATRKLASKECLRRYARPSPALSTPLPAPSQTITYGD